MAGPWEKYQDASAPLASAEQSGPWESFGTQPVAPGGGGGGDISPAQRRYDAALEAFHKAQYPGLTDEQFKRNADALLAPDLRAMVDNATTLGLSDEISSLTGAIGSQLSGGPSFGEAWQTYQELENARLDLAREKAGLLGTVAEIGSSMFTMGPGRAALQQIASQGARQAPAAVPSLMRSVAETGAVGAGLGGVGGFTTAEGDLGERARGAMEGAKWGTLLGVGAPLVARGAGRGYQAVADALAQSRAARTAGLDPRAASFLQQNVDTSPAGRANIQRGGAEGMLADAGTSSRNALDFAIQSSGGAGRMAEQGIGARVTRDSGAINTALDTAFGAPQGVQTTRNAIRTGSSNARSTAYDAAYGSPIDYASPEGMRLEELLQRVRPEDVRAANQMMREEGVQSAQILAQIGDDGSVTYSRLPDVRQIDYITRALNDRAAGNAGLGALGGTTNQGRITGNLAGDLRGALRNAVPEYATALETAADPIRRSQAVQQGSEALRPGTTREMVAEQTAGLSGPELEAYAQGIRSQLDDALANVTRTMTDGDVPAREALKTLRDLSSRAAREKTAMVIGDDAAAQLFDELDRATQSFELRASVANNSRTFQRQNMDRTVDTMVDPDTMGNALRKGEPLNAAKRTVSAFTGATPARALAEKDRVMSEVARALLSQGPDALRNFDAIGQLGRSTGGSRAVAEALIRAGSLGGSGGYAANYLQPTQ